MKSWIFVFLLIGFILASGCTKKAGDEENVLLAGSAQDSEPKIQQTDKIENAIVNDDKFIVANPSDLSHISAISKFRSCVGHDYSGFNADREQETQRSMKHYLNGIDSVVGSSDKIKVYAPFDGKIVRIEEDFASFEGKQRGRQIWLSGESTGDWVFVFFHVDLLEPISEGTLVEAGQHIGYANLDTAPNFDITLKKFGFLGPNTVESPFLHMNSEVVAQYTNKGVKFEELIVPKSVRDAKPCSCSGEYCSFPSNSPENNPEDWVLIE
ncbi:hypothetical protein HYV87_02355 [Candidatus Woesearchaeota archaeon]|nr:hypothetical protein [Candidatus Woesearchaeota archaeon]